MGALILTVAAFLAGLFIGAIAPFVVVLLDERQCVRESRRRAVMQAAARGTR